MTAAKVCDSSVCPIEQHVDSTASAWMPPGEPYRFLYKPYPFLALIRRSTS
jgi:hypothetical protein